MNKRNYKYKNRSKKIVNKRALIVLVFCMTFFSFGSVCGIYSCASQCSKPTEVHAADISGSTTEFIDMTFTPNGSYDFTADGKIYTNASFVAPFFFRIGDMKTVGERTTLFQIGVYSNNYVSYPNRASFQQALRGGTIQLNYSDVVYNSETNNIYWSGSTFLSVGDSYTSTANYNNGVIDRSDFFPRLSMSLSSSVSADFVPPFGKQFTGYLVSLAFYSGNVSETLKLDFYFEDVTISLDFSFDFIPDTSIEEYFFYSNGISYTYYYAVPEVDLSALIQSNYNRGKEVGIAQGYADGYREGKIDGYSEGVANQDYTFGSLFNSLVYAPFKAVVSLFNFDLLGVNMLDFVTSVLTILAMFGLARLFI